MPVEFDQRRATPGTVARQGKPQRPMWSAPWGTGGFRRVRALTQSLDGSYFREAVPRQPRRARRHRGTGKKR